MIRMPTPVFLAGVFCSAFNSHFPGFPTFSAAAPVSVRSGGYD